MINTRILFLFLLLPFLLHGQVIDQTVSYRNIQSDKYFRIHYENDYFTETDKYYTQGINAEFVHSSLRKISVYKLLSPVKSLTEKYGISLEHTGFTPTSINNNYILSGDRPFAAALYLKLFSITNDSLRNFRFSSVLSAGVIGPAAGGKEMQQTIHRWIGDVQPLGWQYQIQNDIIINYQADLEKQLLGINNYFLLNAKGSVMAGTLYNKANLGLVAMAGLFDNTFRYFSSNKKKFQAFVYAEGRMTVTGYDATLQGGIFNKTSVYTIADRDIKRIGFQNTTGIVFKINRLYAEYFRMFTTEEFRSQGNHNWGGVKIGFAF